jgi:hypothetical protein
VERFSIHAVDPKLLDISAWPAVISTCLSEEDQRILSARKTAIEMLISGASRTKIEDETGVDRKSLLKFIKNCVKAHPDGRVYGFRALVPRTRIAPYCRRTEFVATAVGTTAGGSGAFTKLLREYPAIDKLIRKHVFRVSKSKHVYEGPVQIKSLHKRFIDLCRELKLDVSKKYPFNTVWLGKVSLGKYVKKLIQENIDKATKEIFGADAAKSLQSGDGVDRPVLIPFQRVECDAHHIDAFFCILILSPDGEVIRKLLRRLWIIFIFEVVSRVIVGYHLSLREECDRNDVLDAVRHALTKWEPKQLQIPELTYRAGAGFPSSHNHRFIAACWDQFSVDEALVNAASEVKDKLKDVVAAIPIVLPGHNPNDRAGVERVFKTIEEMLFHRLPSTTGSGPADPRRGNPELAAIEYTIQLEDARELIDVVAANYNNTPHEGIGFRTPLEYLEFSCNRLNHWPRQANASKVSDLSSFDKRVWVRGDEKKGIKPHLNFLGARYSSDIFKQAVSMIGKPIIVRIDRRDLRTIRAFWENGSEIGVLRAAPPWHRTPHTLEMRQVIRSLVKKKMLHYVEGDDLTIVYLNYLEQKARKGKYVSHAYLEMRRTLFDTGTSDPEWIVGIDSPVSTYETSEQSRQCQLPPEPTPIIRPGRVARKALVH